MEKYKLLKKNDLSPSVIDEIGCYIFTFEQIIKHRLDNLLLFLKPFDESYHLYFGVRWITVLSTCHKYGRVELIPKMMKRFGIQYTKYDLYALAQLKRWRDFKKIVEENESLNFCYKLVMQYAREADAEAFIVWMRNNFRLSNFVKNRCKTHWKEHQLEHQMEGTRNVYSRLVGLRVMGF